MIENDRALGFREVSAELAAIGLTRDDGTPYSQRQVQRMCEDRKLPFFKAPDRSRKILRSALLATVENWQTQARKEIAQANAQANATRRREKA